MKRMQFIKGWRDLILLVALVQLTFMCSLCLGANNTTDATGTANATAAAATTTQSTTPAPCNAFFNMQCGLFDEPGGSSGNNRRTNVFILETYFLNNWHKDTYNANTSQNGTIWNPKLDEFKLIYNITMENKTSVHETHSPNVDYNINHNYDETRSQPGQHRFSVTVPCNDTQRYRCITRQWEPDPNSNEGWATGPSFTDGNIMNLKTDIQDCCNLPDDIETLYELIPNKPKFDATTTVVTLPPFNSACQGAQCRTTTSTTQAVKTITTTTKAPTTTKPKTETPPEKSNAPVIIVVILLIVVLAVVALLRFIYKKRPALWNRMILNKPFSMKPFNKFFKKRPVPKVAPVEAAQPANAPKKKKKKKKKRKSGGGLEEGEVDDDVEDGEMEEGDEDDPEGADGENADDASVTSDRGSIAERGSIAPDRASIAPGRASVAPGRASVAPGRASVAPGRASVAPGRASVAPGAE